jgi:UDP-glucose-4-epimerase GalE
MRILVTGGSGYVGSHAVRALAEAGHTPIVYDNLSTGHRALSTGFECIEGDIADTRLLGTVLPRVDAVMHFAACAYVGESVANPRKYFRNNVESALKLLDAVLASNVRTFVFSSTCATYGVPKQLPISESSEKNPINPYGATKLFLEQALAAYNVSSGLRSVSLRYFNAAGAHPSGEIGEFHDPETHIIPLALRAALRTAPPLTVFGRTYPTPDGTCIRDFIHVCDLASAHVRALEYLAAGGAPISLNLGTGRGTSVAELLAEIKQITGCDVPHTDSDPRPGDPPVLYADPSRAYEILGWRAQHDIRQILISAWNWEQKLADLGYRL